MEFERVALCMSICLDFLYRTRDVLLRMTEMLLRMKVYVVEEEDDYHGKYKAQVAIDMISTLTYELGSIDFKR